jgi:hypothetical protein
MGKRRKVALAIYVGAVIAAGVVALAGAIGQWGAVELGVWELALFIGLAGVLDVMVVPVAEGGGAAASFAIFFAGLLLLGAGPTAWVAALAGLWSEGVVRRKPLVRTGFNISHSVLSLVAAGAVYGALGGEVGRVALPGQLPAVMGAAVCVWLMETAWVAVAVALERGGRMWRRLRSSLGPVLALDGALASVGLLMALLYQSRWQLLSASSWRETLFLGAIVLIPSGLLYYAYRLQGHLRGVYAQSLRTLGAVMEAKLEGSQPGHGERVAALAAGMAEAMELPAGQVEQIRYAGYLHDIGKVGVPGDLLSRGRDVFAGDPEALRIHPEIGAQILAPVRFLKPAAEMVRAHHERWDGLGYPRGLRAQEIPLGARLLALANAYAGMIHHPSTPCLNPQQALDRIRQAAGSRFDRDLVGVAMSLISPSSSPGHWFEEGERDLTAPPESNPGRAWLR